MKANTFKATTIALIIILWSTLSLYASGNNLVDDILGYTNEYRKTKGKPALQLDEQINKQAEQHSSAMATGKTPFGHKGFDARIKALKSDKYFISSGAENVAYGQMSAKEVVDGWINSATHRKNMLGDFTHIGIAAVTDKNGRTYFTQIFIKRK